MKEEAGGEKEMLILKNDIRRELTHLAGSGTCCVIRQSHLNTRNLLTSLNSKPDRAYLLQLKMAFRQQYSLTPGTEAGFGLVTGRVSQAGWQRPSLNPASHCTALTGRAGRIVSGLFSFVRSFHCFTYMTRLYVMYIYV